MKINKKKVKWAVLGGGVDNIEVKSESEAIEQVENFKYWEF